MVIDTPDKIDTPDYPSAATVQTAEQHLAELAAQQREAEQRLATMRGEQSSLLQEQHSLREQRAGMEEAALIEGRALEQAETDARMAAKSPLGLASATERLAKLRKVNRDSTRQRTKDLARIEERRAAIGGQLATLQEHIGKEQAVLLDLAHQEDLARTSWRNALRALDQEIFEDHTARLDTRIAALEELTVRFVEGQVALREAKDEAYTALMRNGELQEEAIRKYDLLDDHMSRTFDVYIGLWNALEREADSGQLFLKIGQTYLPHALEITRSEWETILSGNADARAKIIRAKRGTIEQLKAHYQVR